MKSENIDSDLLRNMLETKNKIISQLLRDNQDLIKANVKLKKANKDLDNMVGQLSNPVRVLKFSYN